MCFVQGPQRSDAGEATALPLTHFHRVKSTPIKTGTNSYVVCKEKERGGINQYYYSTPGRRQSNMLILSTNVDKKKSLETEFLIAICCPNVVARLATNCNQKHCFWRFLTRVRRLLRAFSIAAYPVCTDKREPCPHREIEKSTRIH